jgi:hypothetical protein
MQEIGKQKQEITYPYTEIQVSPMGILVINHISATHFDTTLIDEATSNNMVKMWIQSRKDIQNTMELANRVRKGMN